MVAQAGGEGKPAVGQTLFCWGPDEVARRKLAHEQFGWALGGWKIQAEFCGFLARELRPALGSLTERKQAA